MIQEYYSTYRTYFKRYIEESDAVQSSARDLINFARPHTISYCTDGWMNALLLDVVIWTNLDILCKIAILLLHTMELKTI